MRTVLLIITAFVGLTATTCGLLLIAYPLGTALGLSLDLLRPTFLNDFLISGIALTIIGCVNLGAMVTGILHSRTQYNWSIAGGAMISTWVIIEMLLIKTILWPHPIYLISGILIILLSWQLKGKWAA